MGEVVVCVALVAVLVLVVAVVVVCEQVASWQACKVTESKQEGKL